MNTTQAAVAKWSKPAEYCGNSSSVGLDSNNDGDDESTIKIKIMRKARKERERESWTNNEKGN